MKGKQGFNMLMYNGQPIGSDHTDKVRVIIMQKNNPNRLDMRYKTNKEFLMELKNYDTEPRD